MVADVSPSVARPLILSRKLSKTDSELLQNTIRKLALLILMPHSDPLREIFEIRIFISNTKYVDINTAFCSTFAAVVNGADRRLPSPLSTVVVNYVLPKFVRFLPKTLYIYIRSLVLTVYIFQDLIFVRVSASSWESNYFSLLLHGLLQCTILLQNGKCTNILALLLGALL